MEAVLETAVRRETDLVLTQEPSGGKEKNGMRSYPRFTFIKGEEVMAAECWIAINWALGCQVMELKELATKCGNHVQVVEVVPPGGEAIIIAKMYGHHVGSKANRPAQRTAGGKIAKQCRAIIAGDINAYSRMWNPRVTYNQNRTFYEQLMEEQNLFVWNTKETMRMGLRVMNHSIIDLTLTSPNLELNWCLLDGEVTG